MTTAPRESTLAEQQREQAARFWGDQDEGIGPDTWYYHPVVRRHVNRSVSGAGDVWPLDWLATHLRDRRFDRALSVGCGPGDLERDLFHRGLCRQIDAFDVSLGALDVARRQSIEEGLQDHLRYFALDANAPALPADTYDVVFCHQSLHHVAKLEKLFGAVLRALRPGGLLYADELVGPSRHEWTPDNMAAARDVYRELVPPEARLLEPLPAPIGPADPSEAIRSSEILPQLRVGFDIEVLRPYGGYLLSLICPHVDWSKAPAGLIERLVELEEEHLARQLDSHYTIVVARAKRGWRRDVARFRYFLEPKVKRLGRELRDLLGLSPALGTG